MGWSIQYREAGYLPRDDFPRVRLLRLSDILIDAIHELGVEFIIQRSVFSGTDLEDGSQDCGAPPLITQRRMGRIQQREARGPGEVFHSKGNSHGATGRDARS